MSEPIDYPFSPKNQGLFVLQRFDSDYHFVDQMFRKTLPNSKIISIQKIAQTFLYDQYFLSRKLLNKKLKFVKEEFLFHGTGSLNPEKIYKDVDVAFDSRFSNAGMWGKAIYFAKNASYSSGYAYRLNNGYGHHCLFLAQVLIGDTIQMEPDSSLVRPPYKPHSKEMYDSVKGRTGGSDVYMIYDQTRAYSLYLITFQKQSF